MKPAYISFLAVLALLLFLTGCRRVHNTNPNLIEERRHFLFFNYSVDRPPMKGADESTPEGGWEARSREFVGDKLRVLLRRGAIPPVALKGFTAESGANVEVEYFDEHADMYEKLSGSDTYDVVMPAAYTISRLVEGGHLGKMDLKAIPNRREIQRSFYKLTDRHDPAEALAYLWTTVGIAYHHEYFDDRPHTWKEFFEPGPGVRPWIEGKRSLLPSARQNFAAALVSLKFSPNSEKPAEIDAAERYLTQRIGEYQLIDHDELRAAFANQTVVVAQATSADVALMKLPDIMFSVPQDGTWMHLDMLALSADLKDERRLRLAHAFINYLLRPVVAASVVEHSRHATTVSGAAAFIRPSIRSSVAFIRGDFDKTYILGSTGEAVRLQEEGAERFHPKAQKEVKEKSPVFVTEAEPID